MKCSSCLLVLIAAFSLVAQAPADSLIFEEDFDDGNADGWSFWGGTWSVYEGALRQSAVYGPCVARFVSEAFPRDVALEVDYRVLAGVPIFGRQLQWNGNADITDQGEGMIYFGYLGHESVLHMGVRVGNERVPVPYSEWNGSDGLWHQLKTRLEGNHFQAWRDGELIFDVTSDLYLEHAPVGFVELFSWYCDVLFDNLKVYSTVPPTAASSTSWGALKGLFQ